MGLATETGELQDQLKKYLFYGTKLDKVNLVEEMGDLFWYLGLMADALDVSFEEIWEKNIRKLKRRYGDKFSEEAARHRNLESERDELES